MITLKHTKMSDSLVVKCKTCVRETVHELYKLALTAKGKIWGTQYICVECGTLRSSIPTSLTTRKQIVEYKEFEVSQRTRRLFNLNNHRIVAELANRYS